MNSLPNSTTLAGALLGLVDQLGRSVPKDSPGCFTLLFFGFTNCKIVCPRALSRLSAALDELGATADSIRALYVSIDPDRDTPDRLREFLSAWPRFTGLTGSREQLDAARCAFRVFVRRRDVSGHNDMAHSAFAHLLDPSGHHIDHWPDVLSPGEIADRLLSRVSNASRAEPVRVGLRDGNRSASSMRGERRSQACTCPESLPCHSKETSLDSTFS